MEFEQFLNQTGLCEIHFQKRFLVRIYYFKATKKRIHLKFNLVTKAFEEFVSNGSLHEGFWRFISEGPFGDETAFETWVDLHLPYKKGRLPENICVFVHGDGSSTLVITKETGFEMRIFYSKELVKQFEKKLGN
jgi:hypothetical protein